MGLLYPIGLTEILPNDSIQHVTSAVMRLSPMQAPVMHGVTIRIHHFFVPHRLSWGDRCGKAWEDFITGGPDGTNADTIPTLTTSGEAKDLFDYYGVPPKSGINVSALPIAGYNLIWNEFYRDQDLQEERELNDVTLGRVAWEKDYFTASRPFAQKGAEISLPLAGKAYVKGLGTTQAGWSGTPVTNVRQSGESDFVTFNEHMLVTDPNEWRVEKDPDPPNPGFDVPGVYADLETATAANINDVRKAFALQRFQEARARFGNRYAEYLRYLGASPSDARLQRPEFLAGGKQRVSMSEVLQTANEQSAVRFGVGDLYGHGIAAMRSNRYRKHFNEHGYIHTLLSVRPRALYTNGIHRTWLRKDKEDFYQRELEFIGQQEVLNNEIFADPANGDQTFGYNDRYREYRENPSCVSGDFRNTLNYWHLGRDFDQPPVLNSGFVECNPSKRIFNVQTEDALWIMIRHSMKARRILSRSAYGKII